MPSRMSRPPLAVRAFLLRGLLLCLAAVPGPLVLPEASGLAAASEMDFAKSELSRAAQASMTGDQRAAVDLVNRYRRFKAAENRNSLAQQSQPAAAPAPRATSAADPVPGSAPGTPAGGEGPVTFALTAADCAEMAQPISTDTLSAGAIERIQTDLAQLGLYHYNIDGRVGFRTRIALRNFCEAARFALADDLQVMLRNHLAIAAVHPNWVDILASRDFTRWAQTQEDAPDIDRTRHLGDAKAVIALIDRFKGRGTRKAARDVQNYELSYGLTKDDLQQLRSSKEIVKRVNELEGSSYATEGEFEAALDKAFKGVSNPDRFISLVREFAEIGSSLVLTEQSLLRLKRKNVAPHILVAMETLRGVRYPDTELAGAVDQVLASLRDSVKALKPEEIAGLAEVSPGGARFTPESIRKFTATYAGADGMASVIAARLQAMPPFASQDKAAMAAAVGKVLRPLAEEINQAAPIIVSEAEEAMEFTLSAESIRDVTDRIGTLLVPEVYVDMLAGIAGLDYPTEELFWTGTKSRFSIGRAENLVREKIARTAQRSRATRIDDAFLGALRDEKVPTSVIALLMPLKDRAFDSTHALQAAVDDLFVKLDSSYEQFRPLIVAQAQKKHRHDKSKVVNWIGNGCDCSNPDLSGDIYGIYPFWLAGQPQEINFSLTSRIGYFGLGFDDDGNILDPDHWLDIDSRFIRVAQSYDVGIDLVLTKRDWRGWVQMGAQEKAVAVDALVKNIAAAITRRQSDLFSRLKPYLSLGLSRTPSMADGVTLYIDGYPDDETSIESFDLLIQQLSARLQADGHRYNLNLMFSSSQLGRGIFNVRRLSRVLETIVSHSRLKARFLVLLQDPTEEDRARVRARIEQDLEGRQRLDLLRSVIMVLTTDGRSEHRLSDNTTFAEDNFGGVGFWTQPMLAPGGGADDPFAKAIKDGYLSKRSGLSIRPAAVCTIVCPNRWGFRIAWGGFLLVLAVAMAVYLYSCNYRTYLERHFAWLIVGGVLPVFFLTMLLLSCDPDWDDISRGNDLLVLVVMGVVGYSLWSYRKRKASVDLP